MLRGDNNAFAQYGTFCHTLLERWALGELLPFELPDLFCAGFDNEVLSPFPPFPKGLGQRYYDAGKQYFQSFDGFGDGYEICGVEERFELEIMGHLFVGVVDLVLRNKETGSYMVIDHKSSSRTNMEKDIQHKQRQLYIYAAYVHEKYGAFPELLRFNLFREQSVIDIPFCQADHDETLNWIDSTIFDIMTASEWPCRKSSYFCQFLCGVNAHCPAFSAGTS